MSDQAPLTQTLERRVNAVAQAVDGTLAIGDAPFDGTVTAATYIPDATITGANTDTRKVEVINKAQDGSGTTSVAALQFNSGINAPADDEKSLTLSVVAGATTVASGDVLAVKSTHVGAGLADPGGIVRVTVSRS